MVKKKFYILLIDNNYNLKQSFVEKGTVRYGTGYVPYLIKSVPGKLFFATILVFLIIALAIKNIHGSRCDSDWTNISGSRSKTLDSSTEIYTHLVRDIGVESASSHCHPNKINNL